MEPYQTLFLISVHILFVPCHSTFPSGNHLLPTAHPIQQCKTVLISLFERRLQQQQQVKVI